MTSDPGRPEDSTSADISTLTKVKNYRIGLMPVRVGNYSPTSLVSPDKQAGLVPAWLETLNFADMTEHL